MTALTTQQKLDCAHGDTIQSLRASYESLLSANAGLELTTHWLDSEDAILSKAPLLDRAQIRGWKAIWSSDGGWLAASKALAAIGTYLAESGVRFASGDAGTFTAPLLADGVCIGVQAKSGARYVADKVVLAAGAWSPALVDLEGQCVSKAWVYAHLSLSPSEAALYKDAPVVYHGEYGFFFEPDENGVVKVCDEFPGFTRFKCVTPYGAAAPQRVSVPRSHALHPSDTYPDASEASVRRAVGKLLPRFVDRPLFNRTLCWCTDTADAALLVCEHPAWRNFFVATGDSGHSFKLLASIGKHVVELLEGTLAEDLKQAWRWRPGTGDALKSRRGARAKDLADMPGWKHEGESKL